MPILWCRCPVGSIRSLIALPSRPVPRPPAAGGASGSPVGSVRTEDHRVGPDDEWREILHEEISRLSDKHRLPLLLCDLEGKTHAQAAAELNFGEATIRRRLAGARDMLRSRLTRRGVALTAGTIATTLGRLARANVPPAWVAATVKVATGMSSPTARIAVGDVVSTTAAALARRSMHAMLWGQLRAATASVVFLAALVGIAWGVGTYGQERATAPRWTGCETPDPRRGPTRHRRRPRSRPTRRRPSPIGAGSSTPMSVPSRGRVVHEPA